MNRLILNYIQKHYQVISFDIFDTLIERKVYKPSDIFILTGQKVLGEKRAEEFCQKRILAEQIARRKKESREVVLNEIYQELFLEYGEQCNILKENEIFFEVKMCQKKEELFPFFHACCLSEKEVYLISDMYLPLEVIKTILKQCGIEQYKMLYVSNEFSRNKRSGELFKFVLNENKINAETMVHIGDSIRADVLGAYKAGIHAVLVKRKNRIGRLIHS